MAAEASPAPRTLVTFDVDGTLIRSVGHDANKFHKDAFSYAMLEVFGVSAHIDEIKHHGSTDKLVLAAVLEYKGVPPADIPPKMPLLCAAMLEYAATNRDQASVGIEVLPGVEACLAALAANEDVLVGLVTGNLEPIAWSKMDSLGITKHFSTPHFGGFGSDHTERRELVAIAARRAAAEHRWAGLRHFHVGDTPADIAAAEGAGAAALGVATGVFSAEDLSASSDGTAVVLPGLADLPAVMRVFGY